MVLKCLDVSSFFIPPYFIFPQFLLMHADHSKTTVELEDGIEPVAAPVDNTTCQKATLRKNYDKEESSYFDQQLETNKRKYSSKNRKLQY